MERLQIVVFRAVNIATDVVVLSLAFLFGCLTRYAIPYDSPELFLKFDEQSILIWYLLFYLSNFFFLAYFKVYHQTRLYPISNVARTYAKTTTCGLVGAIVFSFAYPYFPTSRLLILSASFYAWLFLLLKEYVLRIVIRHFRAHGTFSKPAILVGNDPKMIQVILEESQNDYLLGLDIRGIATTNPEMFSGITLPILGSPADINSIIDDYEIATAIFLSDRSEAEIESALWQCDERGVEVWYRMALLDRVISRAKIEYLREVPFLNLRIEPENGAALLVKYCFDRIAALLLLVILTPLLLLVALLVRISSPGPIIFKQVRTGLNGQRFTLYKFRSMVLDADSQIDSLRSQSTVSGPAFKLTKDPRVTKIGKFLRKFSLDELPQLWNVVCGEMSLVGPRPLRTEEAKLTCSWQKRRLSMKPGLTCIWQVSGRSDINDFDTWIKMDLEYIENWSLWLDMVILIKTIPAVMAGTGAR